MFFYFLLFYVTKTLTTNKLNEETTPTPTPEPTTDYSHEGEITKSGVISIVTVVAVGILIIVVGVACFHKKTPPIHVNDEPLVP